MLKKLAILFFLLYSFPVKANECLPEFPYKQGWLGGDAAYSVKLSNNSSLWLFGDTFIGKENRKTRKNAKIVANTIAISECNQNKFFINYYWNKKEQKPFFQNLNKNEKYWSLHGFTYKNKLYVALERIRSLKNDNTFNFEITGVDLAIINNPEASPEKWIIKYIPLMNSKILIPGISFIKKDSYLYIFSVLEGDKYKDHPIVLLRLPLEKIAKPKNNLEYYTNKNLWEKDINSENLKIIIDKASTEFSVSFNPYLNKWVMVHNKSEFLTKQIVVRISDNLEGSWNKVYYFDSFKEMQNNYLYYDKNNFCYAAKEHIQFSDKNNLVITYACNSFSFFNLLDNMKIYYPQVIELPISSINN